MHVKSGNQTMPTMSWRLMSQAKPLTTDPQAFSWTIVE